MRRPLSSPRRAVHAGRMLVVVVLMAITAVGYAPQPASAYSVFNIPTEYFSLWPPNYCASLRGRVEYYDNGDFEILGWTTSLQANSLGQCVVNSPAPAGVLAVQVKLLKASNGAVCADPAHAVNASGSFSYQAVDGTSGPRYSWCGAGWYNARIEGRITRDGSPHRWEITSQGFYLS